MHQDINQLEIIPLDEINAHLQEVNIRRMAMHIKRDIYNILNGYKEQEDSIETRAEIQCDVRHMFLDFQMKGGITAYNVGVRDATNGLILTAVFKVADRDDWFTVECHSAGVSKRTPESCKATAFDHAMDGV